MTDLDLKQKIEDLKKQKKAIVLAHYYQNKEIQEIADFVGDSLDMAKQAKQSEAEMIVVCGVTFMAETAKILNPDKKILIPVENAGCSLANFGSEENVLMMKEKYPEADFVCYVNSAAEVKVLCDICCTSANAVDVVRSLKQKQIVMLPDKNLAAWVQTQVPEKEIIAYDGYCHCHNRVKKEDVYNSKKRHPEAIVLAHPEVKKEVWEIADFVGSTSAILRYVELSNEKEFIIATEEGIMYQLRKRHPEKSFYLLTPDLICLSMKMVHLDELYESLKEEKYEIILDESLQEKAKKPLMRMFTLA